MADRAATLILSFGVLASAACGDGPGAGGAGGTRFLVVDEDVAGQRLVEYEVPSLAERRSLPTSTADSGLAVLLRADGQGGFYGLRYALPRYSGSHWSLVRYDAGWRIAARRSDAEMLDTISALIGPIALRYTPDRHLLVLEAVVENGRGFHVVLDPATLTVLRRTGRQPTFARGGSPTAAAGSELMLAATNCPAPVVWVDMATGVTSDSVSVPCDGSFVGALARRQLYRFAWGGGAPFHLELYDPATGAVLARSDSLVAGYPFDQAPILASGGRLIYFEIGKLRALDAHTLQELGRVSIEPGAAGSQSQTVRAAAFDSGSGLLFGVTATVIGCSFCVPTTDGLLVVDTRRLAVLVHQLGPTQHALVP